MKYLLVLVVAVVGLWLLLRKRQAPTRPSTPAEKKAAPTLASMVACAHCDLRLPQAEALTDGQGRHYCSEAHRLAGPR